MSSSSKLIQALSYAINHSALPLVSKVNLCSAIQNYIFEQNEKIYIMEHKITNLQTKLESFENQKQNSDKNSDKK